jgi:hypothetical protein
MTHVLIGAGLLLTLACSAITGPQQEPTPTPAIEAEVTVAVATVAPTEAATEPPATEPPPPTEAPTPVTTAGGAGEGSLACIGTFGYGISCIEDETWVAYTRETSALGGDQVHDITTCPDGRMLIAHTFGLSTYDGTTWRQYDKGWGVSSVEALACAPNGDIWVAHFKGASVYDGQQWNTYEAREFLATGPDASDLVEDIAVAPDGTVWVATASSVAMFQGGEWRIFQEGQGYDERYFFNNIALGPDGSPWVTHNRGLFHYEELFWQPYFNSNINTIESMAVDAAGRVWVGTLSQGVFILEDGAWIHHHRGNSDLSSDQVNAIAHDARGRTWLGTEWGLNVLTDDTWRVYRMDNADLVDHNIYALDVAGAGPPLPDALEKAEGSLIGWIIGEDGEPLSGATVEVCVEKLYSRYYGDTPCADQPFVRGTETDADGAFTFEDLPAGFYVVTVESEDGWAQLTTSSGLASERVPVAPDEETDIGEIRLGEEEP